MHESLISIILGTVEGITEFLPISSTGHLILATDLLNLNQEQWASFNIIIQLAAIIAVALLYRERIQFLLTPSNFLDFKNEKKKLNLVHIALSMFPAMVLGFVFRKAIKQYLFGPTTVSIMLILIGILLIIIPKICAKKETKIENLDQISYKDAFIVGCGQCLALIPGTSRSGATMLTSLMLRMDIKTSADFSFLISIPIITLATAYELVKSLGEFNMGQLQNLSIGFITSFIVAYFSVKWFLEHLKKIGLVPFGIYRILIGLIFILRFYF